MGNQKSSATSVQIHQTLYWKLDGGPLVAFSPAGGPEGGQPANQRRRKTADGRIYEARGRMGSAIRTSKKKERERNKLTPPQSHRRASFVQPGRAFDGEDLSAAASGGGS